MDRREALATLLSADGWRTSSYTQGHETCVEVTAAVPGWMGVRDSKLGGDSPILAFRPGPWRALIAHAAQRRPTPYC